MEEGEHGLRPRGVAASIRYRGFLKFAPLALLCVCTGSRWLFEEANPAARSTPGTQALGCALAAMLFALWSLVGERWQMTWAGMGRGGFGTTLAVAGPALVAVVSPEHLSPNDVVLALALVPVVVAVARSATTAALGEDFTTLLWPALAGLAGLLLLLPEPNLSGVRPWLALALMPIATGLGASVLTRRTDEIECAETHPWALSLGCACSGLVFLALRRAGPTQVWLPPGTWVAASFDGASTFLTLLSLKWLGDVRWSVQFFLVPLIALLEGVWLLHPKLDGRSCVGLGLLLLASARYFAGHRREERVSLVLSQVPGQNDR